MVRSLLTLCTERHTAAVIPPAAADLPRVQTSYPGGLSQLLYCVLCTVHALLTSCSYCISTVSKDLLVTDVFRVLNPEPAGRPDILDIPV